MTSKLDLAVLFMQKAHSGQTRNDGKTPYSVHPEAVVLILRNMKVDDEEVLIAGYLHDVIEDTKFEFNDIKEVFGNRVATLVNQLTHDKDLKSDDVNGYISEIGKMSTEAMIIKFADMIANMGDASGHKKFYSKRLQGLQTIMREMIAHWNNLKRIE